jgi:hypothetical protein
MTPLIGRPRRSFRAILAALILALVLPASSLAWHEGRTDSHPFVRLEAAAGAGQLVPLINSGEVFDGVTFQGIPDGLGVVPGPGGTGWVDIYVAHEESHVPFGLTPTSVFADLQDSSVTRVRMDVATHSILEMEVALPASAGLIRFCSAFMAGPEHGFPTYTFLLNEESNDVLPVPAGAPYGPDTASLGTQRQAGYAAFLNTTTGQYGVIPGAGRHNHENTVVVPGGWKKQIVSLSGDDTFTSTSSPAMPNLSQLYMYSAKSAQKFVADDGTLWAFRVTGTQDGPVVAADPQNGANDYFDMEVGDNWTGEFITVDPAVARGQTADRPQDALENWSNANNVFQFIRVEDIAYDPDNPRVVYFADTGNTRIETAATSGSTSGRLYRNVSSNAANRPWLDTDGRIYKLVLNATNPQIVDSFSIVAEGGMRLQNADLTTTTLVGAWMRAPDNLDVGHNSVMVQEDATNAKIWRWNFGPSLADWTHVATVDSVPTNTTVTDPGESSGIIDMSRWLGAGWWALTVQAHQDADQAVHSDQFVDPTFHTWTGGPIPPGGDQYRFHREKGQLLLMYIPGS